MLNHILGEGFPYFQSGLDYMSFIIPGLSEEIKEGEDIASSHKVSVTYTSTGHIPGNN